MIIISDFSKTLLFPKDPSYNGKLNDLYKSVKEEPNFSFFDYFTLNQELWDIYRKLCKQNQIYIFTTDVIQNDTALSKYLIEETIISGIITLKDLSSESKDNPETYKNLVKYIAEKTHQQLLESAILFIDDSIGNVLAAREVGINAIQYTTIPQLNTELSKYQIS